eukprot:8278070-Pyramimonas_sp.AAC.1
MLKSHLHVNAPCSRTVVRMSGSGSMRHASCAAGTGTGAGRLSGPAAGREGVGIVDPLVSLLLT